MSSENICKWVKQPWSWGDDELPVSAETQDTRDGLGMAALAVAADLDALSARVAALESKFVQSSGTLAGVDLSRAVSVSGGAPAQAEPERMTKYERDTFAWLISRCDNFLGTHADADEAILAIESLGFRIVKVPR